MKLNKKTIREIKRFLEHCLVELALGDQLKAAKGHKITVTLSKVPPAEHTAGTFDPTTLSISVAVTNRAMADVMRTLAHELTHMKQLLANRESDTGWSFPHGDDAMQEFEDEANTEAGKLVRFYGRKNKQIYEDLTR